MQNEFLVFIETFSYSTEKKELKFFISSKSARNYMADCKNIEAFDNLEEVAKAINDRMLHLSFIHADRLKGKYQIDTIKDLISLYYDIMFDNSNSILSIKSSTCYYGHRVFQCKSEI